MKIHSVIKPMQNYRSGSFNERLLDEIIEHADYILAMSDVEGSPIENLSTEEKAVLMEARNLLNACAREMEMKVDNVIQ